MKQDDEVELRIQGATAQVERLIQNLTRGDKVEIISRSRLYPNNDGPRNGTSRVYLTVRPVVVEQVEK